MSQQEVANILPIMDVGLRDTGASRSIEIVDRRRALAEKVLTCDPAMVTALESVLHSGLRGLLDTSSAVSAKETFYDLSAQCSIRH